VDVSAGGHYPLAVSRSAALLACRASSAAVDPVGDSITANRSADGSASNSRSHATRYDVCHCSLFASSLALSDFVMVVWVEFRRVVQMFNDPVGELARFRCFDVGVFAFLRRANVDVMRRR
jgi:hypothetical protein